MHFNDVITMAIVLFILSVVGISTLAGQEMSSGGGEAVKDSLKKSLTVTSTPSGADVYIDGQRAGKTPLTTSTIAYGSHKIHIRLEGRLEEMDSVDVKFGDHPTIHKRLLVPGGFNLNSTPQGADVFVDEVRSGFTPTVVGGLRPGKHRVRISTPGYRAWDQPIAVRESTITNVNVGFANVYSTLALDVEPEDAQVIIDTTRLEGTNLRDYPVEPGYHLIRVSHPLIEGSVEEKIYVGPNSHYRYAITMGTFAPLKFGAAVLVPGLKSIQDGDLFAGWGLLASAVVTGTTLFFLEDNFTAQLAEYDMAHDQYLVAKTEQQAFDLGQSLNAKYADLQKAFHIRNAVTVILGGIYAYNLVDLLTSHRRFTSNAFSKLTSRIDHRPRMNLAVLPNEIRLNLSVPF